MSSATVSGVLAVTNGKRVASTNSNNVKTWHAHYATTLQTPTGMHSASPFFPCLICWAGDSVPATVRTYAPAQEVLHPDDTILAMIGSLHAPPGAAATIDANQLFTPFPGNPNDSDYEDHIPDTPYLHVKAIGQVMNKADLLPDGTSRSFNIAVSEWVQDGPKKFLIK